MSARERVKDAIDKLAELKAASTMSPWFVEMGDVFYQSPFGMQPLARTLTASRGDAELIVTLHRTIDAQLAILTRAYNVAVMGREQLTNGEVDLANAILGPDSH